MKKKNTELVNDAIRARSFGLNYGQMKAFEYQAENYVSIKDRAERWREEQRQKEEKIVDSITF